ncbi:hypothetical protein CWS20_13195 [Cytobacillus horneckiae]|uniref:Uncharacterized protein n=1 Tax=Cytobacillus horneckiae TaxID=549687 RepID=A0A2N0ZG77_9BACI|nr:hypothetical protein CWS20_13195 [Cytobacillus horneckiae]
MERFRWIFASYLVEAFKNGRFRKIYLFYLRNGIQSTSQRYICFIYVKASKTEHLAEIYLFYLHKGIVIQK